MTPAGHLLSGYLAGALAASNLPDRRDRLYVTTAGVVAGIAPDFDVVLGLVGGYAGAGLHRGVTHSLFGALALGGLAALVLRRTRWAAFFAAAGGVLTHIFWDSLNFWGVRVFWPWNKHFSANLMHEGDWIALAAVAIGAVLVWRGRRRPAIAWLALTVPAFLGFQVWCRAHARELARTELPGRRAEAFAAPQLDCRWVVLSEGGGDMRAHCVSSPFAKLLRPMLTVPVRDDFFTRASQESPSVQEFVSKCPFAFAEEHPGNDGATVVVWRDLREVSQQKQEDSPTGLQIVVEPAGRIRSEHHNWWLKAW
jgi:membrane-bound metal-dependent hydrolase YbcI (DUF457 family)